MLSMLKRIGFVGLIFLLVFGLSTSFAANKQYEVYLLNVGMNNPYYIGIMKGAVVASREYPNVNLVNLDGREDSGYQASQALAAIAKGVDAILLDPVTSDALVPSARTAKAAGIPVFCVDRDISDASLRIGAVGSNQRLIGNTNAQYIVKFLKEKNFGKPWRIVILEGTPGALANTERTGGWYDVLNPLIKSGDVEIVADEPANWAREPALRVMSQILVKTKDIDVVIASNDEIVAGAISALKAAGLKPGKDVYLTGVDASRVGVDLVKRGEELATVCHQAWLQGYWGCKMAVEYLLKGNVPPKGKFKNNYLITPIFMVDQENVDELAGPFGEPADPSKAPKLPY
ncbi:sugar ABC transporter substrate-binding protein [Candidatus Aerophobetes bacterium]|nr:sugar ABC transporter substrate-binding protein [Candidatus Aerophobetes bacterium]